MVIYIELYLINNFLLNIFLNIFTLKIANQKINKIQLIFVTIFECIVTGLYIYFDLNQLWFKILVYIAISLILTKYKNVKEYIKTALVFLVSTVIIGGISIALLNTINLNIYDIKFTIRILCVYGVFIVMCLFKKLYIHFFKNIKRNMSFKQKVEINNHGNNVTIQGYYDTGNTLYVNLKPVCIISKNCLLYLKDSKNTIDNVNVLSVNNQTQMRIITLDNVYLTQDKKYFKNVYCAVSENLKDFDFLIHADMR